MVPDRHIFDSGSIFIVLGIVGADILHLCRGIVICGVGIGNCNCTFCEHFRRSCFMGIVFIRLRNGAFRLVDTSIYRGIKSYFRVHTYHGKVL